MPSRRANGAVLAVAAALAGCAPTPAPGFAADPSPGRRVITNVEFDFDSARLRPASYPALDNTATALADPRLAGLRFDVDGHTDVIGRFGYNVALSRLRAEAVADYLASRGVPRDRMLPQGFGPLQLLDPYNPTSPVNRRVEIVTAR